MALWLSFKPQVSNFQNEANKILKTGTVYYTSIGLFCAIFHKSSSQTEVAIQLPRGEKGIHELYSHSTERSPK